MPKITSASPVEDRAVALFFRLLDLHLKGKQYSQHEWPWHMRGLLNRTDMNYEEVHEFINWVVNVHQWTAENLRIANDPMGSFVKQFETVYNRYSSKLAAKRAKAKQSIQLLDPGALIVVERKIIDGDEFAVRRIQHRPRTYDEWQTLYSMLRDQYGRTNPEVAKFLVDPKCLKCNASAMYLVKAHPDEKKLKWQNKWQDCECISVNPFPNPQTIVP